MIQQDTIQSLNDSTQALTTDSLLRSDSLINADTLSGVDVTMLFDTLKSVVKAQRGFVGIPHPSLPQTEGWVFGVLLLLFFLLVFTISRSSGLISENIKNFFQIKERSSLFSNRTINDFRFGFFLLLFSSGVFSLYAYLIFHRPSTPFSVHGFGLFLLVTLLFIAFKSILIDLVGYVFLDRNTLKMAKNSYFNILSFLGIALFPLLILYIYIPYSWSGFTEIISLVICVIACILVIIKLFQTFSHKTVASFYILLYLCTLEFLPLIALYQVYQLLIQSV